MTQTIIKVFLMLGLLGLGSFLLNLKLNYTLTKLNIQLTKEQSKKLNGCIFSRNNINRTILSVVLGTFTLTYAIPVQAAFVQFGFGLNEAAFIYRVEKLVEKIWKLEKSDNKEKMYDAIIDLKSEI
jgi:hypothetical protein